MVKLNVLIIVLGSMTIEALRDITVVYIIDTWIGHVGCFIREEILLKELLLRLQKRSPVSGLRTRYLRLTCQHF